MAARGLLVLCEFLAAGAVTRYRLTSRRRRAPPSAPDVRCGRPMAARSSVIGTFPKTPWSGGRDDGPAYRPAHPTRPLAPCCRQPLAREIPAGLGSGRGDIRSFVLASCNQARVCVERPPVSRHTPPQQRAPTRTGFPPEPEVAGERPWPCGRVNSIIIWLFLILGARFKSKESGSLMSSAG